MKQKANKKRGFVGLISAIAFIVIGMGVQLETGSILLSLILYLIGGTILAFWLSIRISTKRESSFFEANKGEIEIVKNEEERRIAEFIDSENIVGILHIDYENRKWYSVNTTSKFGRNIVFDFESIVDVELIEDEETVTTSKSNSTFVGAAQGTFGGGIASSRGQAVSKQAVSRLEVLVHLIDTPKTVLAAPNGSGLLYFGNLDKIRITFIGKQILTSSDVYRKTRRDAENLFNKFKEIAANKTGDEFNVNT